MSLESEIKKLTMAVTNLESAIEAANLTGANTEASEAGLNVEPGGMGDTLMSFSTPTQATRPANPLPTVEEVNAALQKTAAVMGDGGLAVITLMQTKFGSKRLSEIPHTRYAELLDKAKGLNKAKGLANAG